MDTWSLETSGFDPGRAVEDGNRFLCANGYMGMRGTVEEAGSELFPAITLAGVYDRYPGYGLWACLPERRAFCFHGVPSSSG